MAKMTAPGSMRWKLAIVFSLIATLGLSFGAADIASAAKKKKASPRRNYIPSETTGKKLMKAMEFAEKEEYQESIDILEPLTKRKRLKKFDKASVYAALGQMQAALDDYEGASKSFESALAVDYLPDVQTEGLKYGLAQLYMALGNFPRSVELFEEWFEYAENPNDQAEFMITAAYAQTEQWDKALPHARLSVEKSKAPVEQRLGLLLATEFQNGNIPETLEVLKQLAALFPRKRYYEQLAYGYSNLGDDDKALSMVQLIHDQGWFSKGKEYIGLTQRYIFKGLPWRASEILREGLEKELVEETARNYELLANALLHAREYDAALIPLARAADLSEDGELYVRLAQVHLEVENWKAARQSLQSGLSKGDLRNPSQAQLLLGISNYNEKRYKSARAAFRLAEKDERTSDSATKWLKHTNRALGDQATLDEG
jgi:tetratricopeptide (TPR) repeat protein